MSVDVTVSLGSDSPGGPGGEDLEEEGQGFRVPRQQSFSGDKVVSFARPVRRESRLSRRWKSVIVVVV